MRLLESESDPKLLGESFEVLDDIEEPEPGMFPPSLEALGFDAVDGLPTGPRLPSEKQFAEDVR